MANTFAGQFLSNLLKDAYSVQDRNYDWLLFSNGRADRLLNRVKEEAAVCFHKMGMAPRRYDEEYLAFLIENLEAFSDFFDLLGDAYSRELLIKLVEYRILGRWHVKLPLNTQEFWDKYETVDKKHARELGTRSVWNGRFLLNRYEWAIGGCVLKLEASPLNILATFLLEQYSYLKGTETVSVREGDVVIDGGGCYGDTALYFAAKAGKSGKVYCFEFLEEHLGIIKSNFDSNPELAGRIKLIQKAIWKKTGQTLSFDNNGPANRVSSGAGNRNSISVETLSVDDMVKMEKLPKVDFLKLDIEGGEMDALEGARETLMEFKPNLAISVYHKPDDFLTIPRWIHSLKSGYRFYLDHFTIHRDETILFATARH